MTFVLLLSALLISSPVNEAGTKDTDQAVIRYTNTINMFAQCVARSRAPSIKQMIKTPYGSVEELKSLLWVVRTDVDCSLSGERQIQGSKVVLTGAIFEAYLHARLNTMAIPLDKQQTGWTIVRPYNDSESMKRDAQLTNLGACLAFRNPQMVSDLLKTSPMTDAEGRASNALGEVIRDCEQWSDQLSFTQQELRAASAEGFVNRLLARSMQTSTSVPETSN